MEEKIEAMTLCYSESPFDYNARHKGNFIDVCGVKPFWKEYLAEKNIKLNSIRAGYEIYKYYLDNTKSTTEALKEFKGIDSKSKMWIVHKVKRVTKEVKQEYKEELKDNK